MRVAASWSLVVALAVACGGGTEQSGEVLESSSTDAAPSSSEGGAGTTVLDGSSGLPGGTAGPGSESTAGPGTGLGSSSGDESGSTGETIEELEVLFIGNSHTYLDDIGETDLPLLIAEVAQSQGKTLVADSVTAPFESLQGHYEGTEALDRIAEGGWDVVVLQERYRPSVDEPQTLLEYVELFDAEIAAVGAETMLYILWARDSELESQPVIIDNNLAAATAVGASLSPVGPAWEQIRIDYPTMTLAQNDPQSHANRRGAYLNAMVFYGALFLESPVGLPAQTILDEDPTEAEAELLQIAASDALDEI
ncbi:MAG: hypothetical protein AAGF11_36290 [Myxococcota bacterium]